MDLIEKTVSSQMIHKGSVVNLRVDNVKLPNGKLSVREVVEHHGAVAVIPVNKNNEVLLVKQYRYAVEEILWEIPAGKIDGSEQTIDCAKRELLEETGMLAEQWISLFEFYTSPGFSNEKISVFLAMNLDYQGQNLDEDEFLDVGKIALDQAIKMIRQGEIKDAKSIAGLLAVDNFIKSNTI